MQLIMGSINGNYLLNITENVAPDTEEVLAAVAYATDSALLFDWCWDHNIPLKFYGRLDATVAVSIPILTKFLERRSSRFVCRLVQHHHAKVIWWRGVGVYIGSANLTGSAWSKNVEAGCFFPEIEITDEMGSDLLALFATLDEHSTPLTDELLQEMIKRARILFAQTPSANDFWDSPSIRKWPGLIQTARRASREQKRQRFLEEWHSTLQDLRDIGLKVTRPENRPRWVVENAPIGAQTDQFLHAHYYQRTLQGRKAKYAELFAENHGRREAALDETIQWWRELPAAPQNEDIVLNTTAPAIRALLSEDHLPALTQEEFEEICSGVHAIKEYARRVSNRAVGLAENKEGYPMPEKIAALSHRIWNDHSAANKSIKELIHFVLYDGTAEQLPARLWQGITDPDWKIDGIGVSALGELVGWALPEQFPPRNGRTSKALRSLGYDVTVHVE